MMLTFQKVANRKDLEEGSLLRVDVDGKPIVLATVQGKVHAMDAVCSHEGGPLEDGSLEGYELKCPWHYAVFDVRNAKVSEQTVWATDLQSYSVKVDEVSGDIMVSPQPKPQETTIQKERTSTNVPKGAEKQSGSYSSLTLTKKEELEGTDIMTFKFTKDKYPEYKAGQYAFFPLDNIDNDSKGHVRHFSLASSPTEDVLIISTRIRDSQYKQRLSAIHEGEEVKVSKARGDFVLHDDHTKLAIFLSGGIGVTPFRGMIKYVVDKQLPIKITMFDSNRNQHNILYKDEFDKWANQNKNVKIVYTVTEEEGGGQKSDTTTNWSGEHGRIDRSMLERHLTKDEVANAVFYICGPPGMLKAMQELLQQELQIPKDRLKVEAFTGY